jgi:hypothetical protein
MFSFSPVKVDPPEHCTLRFAVVAAAVGSDTRLLPFESCLLPIGTSCPYLIPLILGYSLENGKAKMGFEIPTSRRLALALLSSLLVHALLLSLTFGGQGRGLPGLGFPWQERRFEAPDLRVMLMPMKVTAAEPADTPPMPVKEPLQQATIKPPATDGLTAKPSALLTETSTPARVTAEVQASFSVNESPAQASIEQTVADVPTLKPSLAPSKIPAPMPAQTAEAISPKPAQSEPIALIAKTEPAAATEVVAAVALTPITASAVMAVERAEMATFAVPPQPSAPMAPIPAIAVAASASSTESVLPTPPTDATKQEAARTDSARLEVTQQKAAQQEVQRQQDERSATAKVEAQRQSDKLEAARVEAAKIENAKLETARQEAARIESARLEAARLEAQRQETTRLAAAQLETQRQGAARADAAREAARLDTERQDGVRQDAARVEAARVLAEKDEDAKREARRQAMGRTLNEEAAQRKATEAAETTIRSTSTLPYSLSTTRRARLWGRTDPNVELVQYAEAWARKIESNTPLDTVREVAKRPHTDPMLTVAIRSDGSVESVTFVLSSGVAEVDEAIRQIVQSHAPYRAFPPKLASEVDVIEVRRTWHFDIGIRLY